jgi:L-arabinose isomerase
MWSEDIPFVKILNSVADMNVLLWCYNPYKRLPKNMVMTELFRSSGAVGILQGSAPMKRMGIKFSFVYGCPGEPELEKDLEEYSRAYLAANKLKNLRIGQVCPRCECMTGTYVEEFRLLSKLGPKIVPITAYRLYEASNDINDKIVEEYIKQLKKKYRVEGVTDKSLYYAARATLAVEQIVEEEKLDAIAIEDLNPELHKLLKTRPCLWTDGLREKKIVAGMEGDAISVLGMWVARQLGNSTPMYTEVFTYDDTENSLLMGHAAMHDPQLAGDNPVTIIPDMEYIESDEVEGAWLHFSAKAGPVTVISTFADIENYRILSFKGEALPDNCKLEGFPHANIRIETRLKEFFEKTVRMGMTQHFTVSYDDIETKLEKFCSITQIELIKL